ncbi:spermidine synthase, partial [Ideonella sp.]|uniref:spermidine synthase n=1 Tax=Ideonella sp. TaxID=1929293 RepID=UPI003BB4E96C
DGPQPGWADIGLWLLLSALGSAWLLAVTNHLTQNIAAVPMLWLLPLSLYLLTFVLCFEGRGLYRHGWFAAPLILLLAAMAWGINIRVKDLHIAWAVPLYALGFFVCCMFCHGELSLRKPAPRHLTRFYLCLSLGGALGGLAVSALAPWALNHYYELPIVLMLTALLMLWLLRHYLTANKAAWGVLVLALASTALTGLMGWVFYQRQSVDNVVMMRNFYGASRVAEFTDQGRTTRALYNGAIVHGTQVLSGPGQGQPTTYYGQHSGVAVALQQLRQAAPGPRRVGVIGLGVGTLAAWGQAGDDWRFYELNPHSQQIAEQQFSYLRDTPARHSVVLGDARLVLESELAAGQPGRYDLLVVDAFSSDSIPVHLITREALALYRQHLAPGGIIAFHVSNLFLQLEPVVAGLARDAGLQAHHISSPAQGTETAADWVLVTDPTRSPPWPQLASLSTPIPERPDLAVWTDGRNNLFKILR